MPNENSTEIFDQTMQNKILPRRKFLTYAGVSAGALLFAASCKKESHLSNLSSVSTSQAVAQGTLGSPDPEKTEVDLGCGDVGILNYAYALEQLESAFYIRVLETPYSGMSAMEKEYLTNIRDHEIVHREWFRTVLGNDRIGRLIVNFSSIDFNNRDSVLGTAKAFEDTGVSAYNGAGELLKSAAYLLFAGKIVSVEARHAAVLRDLLSYGSFADNTAVDAMGLDLYRKPPEVLTIVAPYIKTKIIANRLPTS